MPNSSDSLVSKDKLGEVVSSGLLAMEALIFQDKIFKGVDNKYNTLATEVISHLIKSGGKKIRPKLVFIICKMLNYSGEDKTKVAAAVEFIHNATLLHDDVLDESETRHGVKTANRVWGNKSSILVGDLLLTMAFRWLIECGNLNILSIVSEASHSLVQGEIIQMTISFDPDIMRKSYFNIIKEKTASLFSACCEAAAIVSGATNNKVKKLKDFGFNFGMAFQIIDDVLDYTAECGVSGKQVGKDFFEKKVTLPAIIAYEKGSTEEREFWKECFSSTDTQGNFDKALQYIKNHNAIQLSMEEAKHYINAAQENLSIFPDSLCKTILINFTNASVKRQT